MMDNLYGDALVEAGERITSRAEFAEFVRALFQNSRLHPEEWENKSLQDFLQGLAAFVEKMEGYYANIGSDVNCDLPGWRVFADILLAARVYE
jgi:hypothetical protein